ncbi:general transcription factor IIH subunit 2 [Micractinium conductrix]|uniref:General transcription factor IIH subunit 2 n=1 Tax=Micractinium conductrix TaxID=554055 RepID=A0A2P6V2Z5_9CHLO|nr:general transcription factor IIH subunit 2 [Micractinium conductrix]|eukprot:PSC68451.1 general transcription factor IIH subunit 2 [Micractinium conductrix]
MAIRTRWFDDQVEAALGMPVSTQVPACLRAPEARPAADRPTYIWTYPAGHEPRQLVMLGAGMDSRPWRMKLPADLHWYELDQQDVVTAKEGLLKQLGAELPPSEASDEPPTPGTPVGSGLTKHLSLDSVRFPLRCGSWTGVRCDLGEPSWAEALLAAGFDPSQPTVWVAEGLLMYLQESQVTALLQRMAELSPEGSVFVGVSVTEGVIKRIRERQASGERTSDLMSTWQFGCPPDPTEFLAACGWRLQLASTRAQQAAALGLNLEMCSFPGVSNGDASKNGDGERADSRATAAARGVDLEEDDADGDDMRAEEMRGQTAYEREYEADHSWEDLEEDEFGNLRAPNPEEEQRARRRRLLSAAQSARIRRGMIRYVQVVLDLSRAASLSDMRPLRAAVMSGILQRFVRAFFDENPLSQLGLIVLRNGVAERLTELSSSPEAHVARLRANLDTGGDASLQNALDLAVDSLKSIPPYGHREVLFLFAALNTCDPGDIGASIKAAKQHRVRASVVGLAAEMYICKRMTQQTGGTYTVAMNEHHLQEMVLEHAVPPPVPPGSSAVSLVRMGFPPRNPEALGAAAFCGSKCQLQPGGYTCPRCKARVGELPSSCHVCGLSLVSSPHLARSYHHLFPVKPFAEVPAAELASAGPGCGGQQPEAAPPFVASLPHCFGCYQPLVAQQAARGRGGAAAPPGAPVGIVSRCPACHHIFCFECDAFIHEQLHNCPGCESLPPALLRGAADGDGG